MYKTCSECGKSKRIQSFWLRRDGSLFDICKECASLYIDNKKPDTFLWILKEADVPFIEERWIELCRKKYNKDPEHFGPNSVIGTYLRIMHMKSFCDYHYSDTLELNENTRKSRKKTADNKAKADERAKESQEDIENLSIATDILEASIPDTLPEEEYAAIKKAEKTQSRLENKPSFVASHKDEIEFPKERTVVTDSSVYTVVDIDEQSILNNLTPNDTQYLAMKWGSSFKPSEWVKMEEMYQKYCGEFEISVDREAVLISMCKTSINMQRCLDSGDAANASKFSSMFDQLRRSGAFTEAQKKEEKDHYINSLGELVAAVEQEGGVIPKFDYEFEVNPDKVDLTLKDMKSYTYNLVKNEMGLGDLIESYIQKLEQQMEEEKNKNLSDGLVTSKAEEQQLQNDEYADDWLNNLEDSIAANADELYAKFDSEEDEKYIEMIRANQQEDGDE